MTHPSFFPLIGEADVQTYEALFAEFFRLMPKGEKFFGFVKTVQVPKEEDVLLFCVRRRLMLSNEQCERLIAQVPELQQGSPAHKELIRRVYTPEVRALPVNERSGRYMIATINAVITKYNEGLK